VPPLRPLGPAEGDPFSRFLGLRWDDDPGTVRLEIRPELLNSVGILLGPVSFAVMDYGMTSCLWQHVADDELIATINISINYVRGVDRGTVTCRAELQRRNRRNGILAAEIRDEDEDLLSAAIGTFAIFPATRLDRPRSAAD
jgi:uncharacterized protein (TIGR00369 family)